MAGELLNHIYFVDVPKSEVLPQNRTLTQEMTYLRTHWKEEGLPKNYLELPGIEFRLDQQMEFFASEKVAHMFLDERKKLLADFTAENLRGWANEYPARRSVNVGLLRFQNGQWIDVTHGASFPLSETLSKKERGGVPYDIYINKAQPFFEKASDGSIMVVNSTQGESMPGFDPYTEGRISILEKNGDDTRIYTISNTFDFPTHKAIMDTLRKKAEMSDAALTDQSSPIDYMRAFAQFDRATHPTSVLEIVEDMEQASLDVAGKERSTQFIYNNKTFADVKRDVQNFDSLWTYDDTSEHYIQEFSDFLRFKTWDYHSLKEALAVTVLRLSHHILEEEDRKKAPKEDRIRTLTAGLWDTVELNPRYDLQYGSRRMGDTLRDISFMAGCVGTATSDNPFASPLDRMIAESSVSAQFEKIFKTVFGEESAFVCPNCDQKTEGKVGNQCPHCKITMEEWKKKASALGKEVCA